MEKKTYNIIWDKGISLKAKKYVREFPSLAQFNMGVRDVIFFEYDKLRQYTKIAYMKDKEGLLDRHKVCACLMIAIAKSEPILYKNNFCRKYEEMPFFNEKIAIEISLDVLRMYLTSKTEENNIEDNDFYKKISKEKFATPKVNINYKATYKELLAIMLHYDVSNEQYSILSIANILYLIEEYSRLQYKYEKLNEETKKEISIKNENLDTQV